MNQLLHIQRNATHTLTHGHTQRRVCVLSDAGQRRGRQPDTSDDMNGNPTWHQPPFSQPSGIQIVVPRPMSLTHWGMTAGVNTQALLYLTRTHTQAKLKHVWCMWRKGGCSEAHRLTYIRHMAHHLTHVTCMCIYTHMHSYVHLPRDTHTHTHGLSPEGKHDLPHTWEHQMPHILGLHIYV